MAIFGRHSTITENGSEIESCKLRLAARSERQPKRNAQKVDFAPLYRVDGYGARKAAGSVFGSAALKREAREGRTMSNYRQKPIRDEVTSRANGDCLSS